MRVVLTREAGHNDEARSWFEGDDVSEVPLTSTNFFDPALVEAWLRASPDAGAYRVLVVTSARSAPYAAVAREVLAPNAAVVSVGAATSAALVARGVPVTLEGADGAEALAPLITEGPVLLLGAKDSRPELARALGRRGLGVHVVACYETVARMLSDEDAATLAAADVVVIGAPSAWAVARGHVRASTWVCVPGATTAREVSTSHERVITHWGPGLRQRVLAVRPAQGR